MASPLLAWITCTVCGSFALPTSSKASGAPAGHACGDGEVVTGDGVAGGAPADPLSEAGTGVDAGADEHAEAAITTAKMRPGIVLLSRIGLLPLGATVRSLPSTELHRATP
jgi:hypothetical protein